MVGQIKVFGDKHGRWFDVNMGDINQQVNTFHPGGLRRYSISPVEFEVDDNLLKYGVEWFNNLSSWGRRDIEFKNSDLNIILNGCSIYEFSAGVIPIITLGVSNIVIIKNLTGKII